MADRRMARWTRALIGLAALLGISGCAGVGIAAAPRDGSGSYEVWGLNEASSDLTGADRTVVLNGDLEHDAKPFLTATGTWQASGYRLDDDAAGKVRDLAGALPDRTGDPHCSRLVLVDNRLFGDKAVAVIEPDQLTSTGPLVAARLG